MAQHIAQKCALTSRVEKKESLPPGPAQLATLRMESHMAGDWACIMWDPLDLVRLCPGERAAGAVRYVSVVCLACSCVRPYAALADTWLCLRRWHQPHTRAGVAQRRSLPRWLRRWHVCRRACTSTQWRHPHTRRGCATRDSP
jgi:hypothetical protein